MPHPRFNPEKSHRAAVHPLRDGQNCNAEGGLFVPIVDTNRCKGRHECEEVCPYDVFYVRRMDDDDFAALSVRGKVNSLLHQRRTAYTPNADQCKGCGLCVVACPESAVRLVRSDSLVHH